MAFNFGKIISTMLMILLIALLHNLSAQEKTTIYGFPGQGSDKRIFDSLSLPPNYNLKIIEYNTPQKKMSMEEFAKQLSTEIDTSQDYILLGISLGGMLCVEISEILNPEKTIIISSAKNRNELPFRYKFQKAIPLYKLFPGCILLAGAKVLQPIVEPDRNKNKDTFKSMLKNKEPLYMKRTIGLITNWNRQTNSSEIIHIQGTNDHTIPLRKVKKPNYIIENGSHMMTLTRGKDISTVLDLILND